MSYTVTYPGQNAGTGDVRNKFLKLFTGEVLAAFAMKNIALGLVKTRTISGGKSAQFITTGRAAATDVAQHTPGSDVVASVIKSNERVITIDSRYYYSTFLDDLEQKLAQWEMRGEIARQHAEVLATKIDKAIFQGIYDSAAVAPQDGQTASISVNNAAIASGATAEAKGDAIIDAIFAAQAGLDTNYVPTDGRVFVTSPVYYYNLVQSKKAINRDWNDGSVNGTLGSGRVFKIAGLEIVQTNHLPTPSGVTLVGMVFTPEVYGVVKAMEITSEANYLPQQLGTLLTSYYALGMGTLNPSALAVVTANAA